jgi:6,7-dimethyl-8-ribityllumazine synthase
MNQTQDAGEARDPSETTESADGAGSPPAPQHPRFVKPQRVAFVQSAWHREVIEGCRVAFLGEM